MSGIRLPRPEPRAEFRKKLRAELMNEAVALAEERRLRRRSFADRLRWWVAGPRLRATLVVASLIAMLLAGTGVAAAGSLPGDPAFGLKRAAEEVELAFARTADAKIDVLAAQSQRRLDDLTKAAATRPDKAPTASAEYEAAVQRFASAVQALRAAPAGTKHKAVEQVVEAARDKHVPVLEELKQRLPDDAQQGIERAIEQHEKLAPHEGDRSPKPSVAPGRSGEPARTAEPARTFEPTRTPQPTRTPEPRETPRPTETQRSGRATGSPSR